MLIGSVMSGRADPGVMMRGPEIANVIVSSPGFAFAFRMACRSDPAPLGFELPTRNGLKTTKEPANGDVLFSGAADVAVAVTCCPTGTSTGSDDVNTAAPEPLVATVVLPRNTCPWS